MKTRFLLFAGLWLAVLILWWPVTSAIVNLGLHDERYVQIMVAPLLAIFLMYWERNRVFERIEWSSRIGFLVFLFCLVPYLTLRTSARAVEVALPWAAGLMIGATMAAFIGCFGVRAFRAGLFPLCCLLLMLPVPSAWMDRLTADLQHASAVTSVAMLRLAGVPVFTQGGNRMLLPGLEIEVAPECSGIHSFLSLALVALCVGRICLGSGWSRLVLVAATVPFAIFKNAVRISVISSLGAYVNRAFLFGRIHHYGGLVFTPLAVVMLFGLLIALQRLEARLARPGSGGGGEEVRSGPPKLLLWSEQSHRN